MGWDAGFLKAAVKQALNKGMLDGATSALEDLANGLDVHQLDMLIAVLQKVRKAKSSTIEVEVKEVKTR